RLDHTPRHAPPAHISLYRSAHHRHLLSFPTRRSSDLTPSFDAKRAVLFDDRWASAREDLARVALGEIDLPVKRFQGTGETIAKQAEWWAENTDRKSTRLNSSHVSISYAVFCLKKKKYIKIRITIVTLH